MTPATTPLPGPPPPPGPNAPTTATRTYGVSHAPGKEDCKLCRGTGVSSKTPNKLRGVQRECKCIRAEAKAAREEEARREAAQAALLAQATVTRTDEANKAEAAPADPNAEAELAEAKRKMERWNKARSAFLRTGSRR